MADLDFERVVNLHYATLYRFALSLTHNEVDASDLTQQTCFLWATKGHQVRDHSKLKAWLLTTLHREFLGRRRHETKFQHIEISMAGDGIPRVPPDVVELLDGKTLMLTLARVDEVYRVPLALYYLEDMSYKEIAESLDVPTGTVMSRLSRGKAQLRDLLSIDPATRDEKAASFRPVLAPSNESHGYPTS